MINELETVSTDDLLHDYHLMLSTFGSDDKDVTEYGQELKSRGVDTGKYELYQKSITKLYGVRSLTA